MRREKWWWLLVALVISVVLHLVVGLRSRMTDMIYVPPARPELEITLETPTREKPLPKRPAPKPPTRKLAAKPPPVRPERRVKVVQEVRAPRRPAPVVPDPKIPVRPAKIAEIRPEAPTVNSGGVRVAKLDRPMPLGMITPRPTSIPPSTAPEETPDMTAPAVSRATPRVPTDRSALPMLNPLKAVTVDETPTAAPRKTSTPRIMRVAKADRSLTGGGTLAPSSVLGGHDGARGPEAPPDDLLFNGGGAGGEKLPRMAPRIGGGGGNPILSVPNPLAAEAVPDEHPGLGAGRGGGEGRGAGGGAGFGRGHGVGVNANGASVLASLRRKPGIGLGAGHGSGRGTFAPGGGQGTGSELPGTGGTGLGYGRGSGLGIGSGFRPGVGAGGSGGGNAGGGVRMASGRGIPFGDITGLLHGGDADGGAGKGGGPGGTGRGAGAGGRSGASGSLHIVYLLDVSGSMRYNNKIGKAQAAMIKALSQLKRSDWFNIICFDKATYPFATALQKATPENVQRATDYINSIVLDKNPGTNMSQVLEQALALKKVSEIYLMSDGTPNGGINDFDELRADVRKNNAAKVPIYTLALGVGEKFKGADLMKGMAQDNGGKFDLINLKGDRPTADDKKPKPDHS